MAASKYTQKIVDFIVDTQYEDIPELAIENAKARILDTIGVTIKGMTESVGDVMRDYVDTYGGKSECTLINSDAKTDILNAVFVNGVYSHAIDFDDHYILSHPSVGVLAPMLAVGEMVHATGKELLTAFVVGLEINTKMQVAVSSEPWYRGFHGTGLWNTLSSFATAAKLLKLDKEQTLNGWGTACSSFCGVKRNMGTMTKPYHVGRAAQGGVLAALLAQKGLTSHPEAFDGQFGFLWCFKEHVEDTRWNVIEELGEVWDLVREPTLIKPHPSCGGTHAAMEGMRALMAEHPDIVEENVDHIDVGMNEGGVGELFYNDPANIYEAKFSMPFVIALMLHFGRWGVDLHTNEVVEELRPLYSKVNFFVDKDLDAEIPRDRADFHAIVTIFLKDGTSYGMHALYPILTFDEVKFKFDCNVDGIITKEKADLIADTVHGLEDLDGSRLFEAVG